MGSVIFDVCDTVPHGVLVFFSSYKNMDLFINRWRSNGTYARIEKIKDIYTEPRFSSRLAGVMKDYRETIQDTNEGPRPSGVNGAILFAVFRGKVAEGIDFSDNEARCVMSVSETILIKIKVKITLFYGINYCFIFFPL